MAIERRTRRVAVAVLAAVLSGPVAAQTEGPRPHLLHFQNAAVRAAVERAVVGASRRFETEQCQKILTDFADPHGNTLAANLADRGMTPSRFMADLRFVDAGDHRLCGAQTTGAFTTPGSPVIWVCGRLFADQSFSLQGPNGEAVIIHEVLHALGLGENGANPTSGEITRQVRKRCLS